MNRKKTAMIMTILVRIIEEELFEEDNTVTISQEEYHELILTKVGQRAANLISDAVQLMENRLPAEITIATVFVKEKINSLLKEQTEKESFDKTKMNEEDINFLDNYAIDTFLDEYLKNQQK